MDARQTADAALGMDGSLPLQEAAVDGGVAADAGLPPCGGARARGLCWYLGPDGESCQQVCRGRGGYDPAMAAQVGTESQGGSADACDEVLAALGQPVPATIANRPDNLGFGCHLFGAESYWLRLMPDFSPTAAAATARVACACQQ